MCALGGFEEIRKLAGIMEVSIRLQAEGSRDPKQVNTATRVSSHLMIMMMKKLTAHCGVLEKCMKEEIEHDF